MATLLFILTNVPLMLMICGLLCLIPFAIKIRPLFFGMISWQDVIQDKISVLLAVLGLLLFFLGGSFLK